MASSSGLADTRASRLQGVLDRLSESKLAAREAIRHSHNQMESIVETLNDALDDGQDINAVLSKVRDEYRALHQLQIDKVQDIETKIQRITTRLTLSRAANRAPSPTSPADSSPTPERKTSTYDRPKPGPPPPQKQWGQ